MELGRNAGHVCISGSCIEGKFFGLGVRNCIPVDLGFVFSVRGVPHDFGAVGTDVTDGNVCDVCVFDGAECRECERSLRAIHEELRL